VARWMDVLVEELKLDEGFRRYAYPDPLSPLAKATKSMGLAWGHKPASRIMVLLAPQMKSLSGAPWTVGYGNAVGVTQDTEVTEEQAEAELRLDAEKGVDAAKYACPSFDAQVPARKNVLANMGFNLGAKKLSGFHGMLGAIDRGDFAAAGVSMLNSRWARQVGNRARRLAQRMVKGDF
jgi:lysozyme